MKRRVVVTGMGAITPIGNSVEEFWTGIKAGQVGIGEITKFDTTEYKVKLAAEVKDFVAKERMDFKAAKRMETFSQYAVAAAKEAFENAGLCPEEEDAFRMGVIVGSGIGSLQVVEREYDKIQTKGPSKVNPLMVPLMISNMAAGNVAIQLGLKGKCTSITTACATGTHAIGDAFRAIQYGDADVMLAGGAESSICPTAVAGFSALTALTASTDKNKASIPLTKTEADLSSVKVRGLLFWKNWNMPRREERKFTVKLRDTGQPVTRIISPPLRKTEAGRQKRWSWPCRRQVCFRKT